MTKTMIPARRAESETRNASQVRRVFRPVCWAILLFLLVAPRAGLASSVCDIAAQAAADETGVPVSVLRAITRNETGRKRAGHTQPWPWTVNMEGEGVWFDTRDEALSYAFNHFKRGARSFDVGCFQINYKWHGAAFSSIEEMFDPHANATYAASFLKQLHAETGNWLDAAGAYHSRTKKYADRYKERFQTILASLSPEEAPPSPTILSSKQETSRENSFPLLRSDERGGELGSLVPVENAGSAPRPFILPKG